MNVVFDLGGVLVRWEPASIISRAFSDSRKQAVARKEILSHPDWLELDRGTLDYEEAITRAIARSGLSEAEVRRFLESVPPSLVPIPETVDLLHRLDARGHPLFCLSNMGHASIDFIERRHDFFRLFTGKVVSCRLKLCKPDAGIFRSLLDTYRLKGDETVFTDDVQTNVDGATKVGIRAFRFENAAQCERELRALGCL